ncbi:cytochrome P450 [Fictibacillus enclensis]|uniref:cytochrome P450 n=1 Tax=Fictibacillus enclensis TaxID=1017270 RepID=UPI00259FF14F|nr:cytochrome P450 [Fictibacillus enclensis]MDM5337261.1 cytochrome P450 [Fictibacillus enclensis]
MSKQLNIPKEEGLDHSLALIQEGYQYITSRRTKFKSDLFETRLLGQKVVCIGGQEGAELFYDNEKFERKGAVPKRIQKSLFGENAIHTLDGEAHEHRKLLFMSLMTEERLELLAELTREEWRLAAAEWAKMEQVVLFDEVQQILCRVACRWAGVPIDAIEVKPLARDFIAMVDAFGAVGPRHQKGRKARKKMEDYFKGLIVEIRHRRMEPIEGTALHKMAWHRDHKEKHLDEHTAAVELLNVLRPIVAITYLVTFGALALFEHNVWKEKLQSGDEESVQLFAQEVRRFYPFAPFLGAKVKNEFEWKGHTFEKGQLVLLDVYGTNHDNRLWEEPYVFNPERFRNWNGGMFDLIPQGGGDEYTGHRCPGEMATIQVMKTSFSFLTNEMIYNVPVGQDLSYSLSRMPTYPESGFIIQGVSIKSQTTV